MEFKNYQNYNMRGLIKIHELPKYVQVYNKLLLMIKRGQYPPASKLPSEGELAKNFGVSRVTLRLSLSLLKEDGFINSVHGQGHFVNSEIESDVNKGLSIFKNPLSESLIIPFDRIENRETYYFLNPSSLYTDRLFQRKDDPYYSLNIWYKQSDSYIANTFTIIMPETIKKFELDLDSSEDIINFIENSLYESAKSSHLTMSISSRENDSFRRKFKEDETLILLTENLFESNGELLAQNKFYITSSFFKTSMIRYKNNYNNVVNTEDLTSK